MFIPKLKKSQKPRKMHKTYNSAPVLNKNLTRCNFGVISSSFSLIKFSQLEALRKYISRRVFKKSTKLHRISLTHTLFKKSTNARMGKGSGKFFKWFGYIKPGMVLFEFTILNLNLFKVQKLFKSINSKSPVKIRLIYKSFFY